MTTLNSFPFVVNNHVALATEMMAMRLRVNQGNYELLRQLCYEEREKCRTRVQETVGKAVNVGSPAQVGKLLYGEMGLKVKLSKHTRRPTTDENALRELRLEYPRYKEMFNAFIEERKISKKIESYIEIRFDEDGCIGYSANPAGTETNRWSFSKSPRDRGLNAQTMPKVMRLMCEAPVGGVFICPDLPQADARIVAWDAQCEKLIDLFGRKDVHFHLENCIRLFGLTREAAYDPHFKSEDPRYTLGKAMGHAANYRMAARRLAMELGVDLGEAKRLLDLYLHTLYPEIERWHYSIKERLRRVGYLETPWPFARKRVFYGAWGELLVTGKVQNSTWNEACAHIPQSAVADIVNTGMERLWEEVESVRFHKHDHDSYLASVPGEALGVACRSALSALRVELRLHGRPLVMEAEMQVGTNYGQLVEWKGEETLAELRPRLEAKAMLDPEKLRRDLYGWY